MSTLVVNLKRLNGYYLPIKIGLPEKSFSVLLDTVTPILWVPGPECRHRFCNGKTQYTEWSSVSAKKIYPRMKQYPYDETRKTIAYEHYDDITMNQMNDEELKVKNAAFGTPSVLKWNDAVMYYRTDGVLVTATLTLGASNDYICAKSDKQVTEKLVSSRDRYDFAYSSISMGNKTFSLQWRSAFAYIHTIKPYIAVPDLFMQEIALKYNAKKADARCELGFRSHSGPLGPVALGIPFLNQYCAILEPTKRSISFRPIVVPNITFITSEDRSLK
ncbi:unnamed protein product [Thelazia callipaeda]|uniref:Peptidase A1 domain-containing protein n=1 Tax=Thelazia callipaeda TaxID=103827 RepID=A0A0N5DCG3_THECL|nr:unnamed protein product [Thelazia callipaeda]